MAIRAWGPLYAACITVIGVNALVSAFVTPFTPFGGMKHKWTQHSMHEGGRPAKIPPKWSTSSHISAHNMSQSNNQQQPQLAAGLVLSILTVVGIAAASGKKSTQRHAFCSSSSGFLGCPTVSSFAVVPVETPAGEVSQKQGVAGMEMKNQAWWIKNTGFDGRGGKIFDWRRRESRRRGEELFRHDVDNFEMNMHNLIAAPGSAKKKVVRGRGKYGSHGRTCGYGNGGAHKRGRRTLNPGYEGGVKPLHIKTPILTKAQQDSMKRDPFTPVYLETLNMCDDGDEVDYMDLFMRGLPVQRQYKFDRIKVKGTDIDEFDVKNLTVYAHAFEPPAREKIEKNGGRCVRLHEWSNLPLDEGAIRGLPKSGDDEAGDESAQEEK